MATKPQCGIVSLETGGICEELLHFTWPFCYQHGQEYKTYQSQCETLYLSGLEPAAWANWRRTGEIRQGREV